MAHPPGALALAELRARARIARRIALITLCGAITLLASTQMLAERAPTREETFPLAVLALAVFLLALPALALTQFLWGARVRGVRHRELELYASGPPGLGRAGSRLAFAGGWAVTLLLGFTVPRLFREAGLYATADALARSAELLALTGYGMAVFFGAWWARDTIGALARLGGPPGDPWDPGRGRRKPQRTALWIGAAVAVAALLGARAHLWEPGALLLYALLGGSVVALVACGVVTDE